MGSSLGPVLANIIMTECEKVILPKLIKKKIVKFYVRFVDDTLLLVKKSEINKVLAAFNSFNSNLQFTVDDFTNTNPHFLDLEICSDNGLKIFRKDTHTGQYVHIDSFTPWRWKTAWIRSLADRAIRLCSPRYLQQELKSLKDFAAWNGFPRKIVNSIINRASNKKKVSQTTEIVTDERPKVFFSVDFAGSHGENLIKKCFKKLNRFTNQNVNFVTHYSVKKLSFYTNMKDKTDKLSKSSVVYEFTCPGCAQAYIGKTDRTLYVRTKEHATTITAVKSHIESCANFHHLFSLYNMYSNDVDVTNWKINIVRESTKILDASNNWNILLFKEAYYIKQKQPILNTGVKASRDLQLF